MAKLVNKSQRVIHIDGTMLVPGGEFEVMDEAMERSSVKALIEEGELEVPKGAAKPAQPAPPAGAPKA